MIIIKITQKNARAKYREISEKEKNIRRDCGKTCIIICLKKKTKIIAKLIKVKCLNLMY